MILQDLVLPSRVRQCWQYSGIDSPEQCLDREHFKRYPHDISYVYNSRGFRDAEWPTSHRALRDAIWCMGDSFTTGIGQPLTHTWPTVLADRSLRRTINISMDGASNQWIARRTRDVMMEIRPKIIIIMWSYLHRRESVDKNLSDEERKLHFQHPDNLSQDVDNFRSCLASLDNTSGTKILHFLIPGSVNPATNLAEQWSNLRGPDWPDQCPEDLESLPNSIKQELKKQFRVWDWFLEHAPAWKSEQEIHRELQNRGITLVKRLDRARDGHHFDLVTSQWIVDRILDQIDL